MAISVEGLYTLCSKNIVEIKFVRRNKFINPSTRRMLCTIDQSLLRSTFGVNILKYKKPKNPPPYNAKAKGLCTLWDILMQDWRNVPTESIEVVSYVSTTPQKTFLQWFDKIVKPMSEAKKINFMSK